MSSLKEYFLHDGAVSWWEGQRETTEILLPRITGDKVLDVGVGKSFVAKLVKKEVVGIDISRGMIQAGKVAGVDYIQCDAEKLPFRENAFEQSYCVEVLMHVPNPQKVISEMLRVTAGDVMIHYNVKTLRWVFRLLKMGKMKQTLSILSAYYPGVRRVIGLKAPIWNHYPIDSVVKWGVGDKVTGKWTWQGSVLYKLSKPR